MHMKKNTKKTASKKGPIIQTHLSRTWFMAQGCKLVPLDKIDNKILWANGDEGYFLSAAGTKQALHHGPCNRKKGWKANNKRRGFTHPQMRHFGCKYAHRLMAYAYAEEPCPIFLDSKGKPYKGIVHHVIENPYDIRVDNLIWWLTYKQHHIADKRRQALEEILPDMYAVPTAFLKTLQDPRVTSDETFLHELEKLRLSFNSLNS